MIDSITGSDESNKIFSVKIKSLGDLSNPKNDVKQMNSDILPNIQQGDLVSGETTTGLQAKGKIIQVKKDSEGTVIEVEIDQDGIVISLLPNSVTLDKDGEKGNQQVNSNKNIMSYIDYQNQVYEKVKHSK